MNHCIACNNIIMRSKPAWFRIAVTFRVLVLLWALSILLVGCEIKIGGKKDKDNDPPAPSPVFTHSIQRGTISNYLLLNAVLEADREVDIFAETFGKVVRLNVEEGDRVQSGELLAKLEDIEQQLAREQAQAALQTERASLKRAGELAPQNMISDGEFERIELAVYNAELVLRQAELSFDYTHIKAPFDGMVTQRYVDVGDRVDQARPLFRLVDTGELLINAWVAEADYTQLKVGQTASVKSSVNSERTFTARLIRVSPVVDPVSGKIKVTFELSDPKRMMKPGQFVELSLTLETRNNTLILPKKAVVYEAGAPVAYIARDTIALRRPVKLGLETENLVELLGGLSLNDTVIIEGQATLRDSARIKIIDITP